MPNITVSVHLEGGGKASIEIANGHYSRIKAKVAEEINKDEPSLTINLTGGFIEVDRSKVIGWSVDES